MLDTDSQVLDTIVTYDMKSKEDIDEELVSNVSIENFDEWIAKIENGEIKPNSFEHLKAIEAVTNNTPIDVQVEEMTGYYTDNEGNLITFVNVE